MSHTWNTHTHTHKCTVAHKHIEEAHIFRTIFSGAAAKANSILSVYIFLCVCVCVYAVKGQIDIIIIFFLRKKNNQNNYRSDVL